VHGSGFILAVPVDTIAAQLEPALRQPRRGDESPEETARLTVVDAAQVLLETLRAGAPTLDRPTHFADALSLELGAPHAVGALPGRVVVVTTRVPPMESPGPLCALSKLGDLLAFYADSNSGSYLLRLYRGGEVVRRRDTVPPQPTLDQGTPLAGEPSNADAEQHLRQTLEAFAGGPALWTLEMETH
jgi:hypothetical protein